MSSSEPANPSAPNPPNSGGGLLLTNPNHPLHFKVVFVFGAPGAGKGTLCSHAAQQLGYYHFSAGDYLRKLAAANSDEQYPAEAYAGTTPESLRESLRGNQLIDNEAIVGIMEWKLRKEREENGWQVFLVDGFPRNLGSAVAFERRVGEPSMAVYIRASRGLTESRFLARARETTDTPERYEARYQKFLAETVPVTNRYSSRMIRINNESALDESLNTMVSLLNMMWQVLTNTPQESS